ncbi:sensor histidine kinase [Sphaerisporangium perillae]|uniref:sensor histidine kinase n=1 Tax=Sphaerisporangium perillae TaxID=2935860 RepID=UPI00200BDF5C|nr:ATP-binding protein [Sphaerisporangium perillae]
MTLHRVRGLFRWTVQLRLTLMYGALFLVTGALLLGVTYMLVAHSLDWVTVTPSVPPANVPAGGPPAPQAPVLSSEPHPQAALQRANDMQRLLVASGIALVLMTLVSGGLGWLMARRALRPLRTMAVTAKEISERNLHRRLAVPGPQDEIKDLADTFDGLLSRLEDAFEAQRRFVANASHELRTPLTLERSLLEIALADPEATATELRETCRRVLASNQDQERLIEALLTLARSQRGLDRRVGLDLATVTAELVAATRAHPLRGADGGEPVRVEVDLAPALTEGDLPLVERMVGNLLDNAVRHNVAGGWVRVRTGVDGGRPTLRVTNSGPVIPADQVGALFQPFHRMNAVWAGGQDGLGVGLSIVAAIATAHAADLHAEPVPGGGFDIRVRFPPTSGASSRFRQSRRSTTTR